MIKLIKGFFRTINEMIVALVEFDYEAALKDMDKKD
jgi:hypothetical protein